MSAIAYNAPMSTPDPLDNEIQRSIRLTERLWRRIRSTAVLEGKSANDWMVEQLERALTPAHPDAPPEGDKGGLVYPKARPDTGRLLTTDRE
jgi:hypothetical protein